MKSKFLLLALGLFSIHTLLHAQEILFSEKISNFPTEQFQALTLRDYKEGVYGEISKRLKRGERFEVIVEMGGEVIDLDTPINKLGFELWQFFEEEPNKFTEYKAQLFKLLPENFHGNLTGEIPSVGYIVFNANQELMDILHNSSLVSSFYINAELEPY